MSVIQTNSAFWLAYSKMDEMCKFFKADIVRVQPVDKNFIMFIIMKNDKSIMKFLWDKEKSLPDKPAFHDWDKYERLYGW